MEVNKNKIRRKALIGSSGHKAVRFSALVLARVPIILRVTR